MCYHILTRTSNPHNQTEQNNDREIDAEDLKTYWTKLKKMLTKNMPDATGFSLGFLYGLTN